MEITSKNNDKVKQWVRYQEKKYRELDQMFLVEGTHLIEEAKKAGLIECIIVKKGFDHPYHEYPIYEVNDEIMKKISSSVSGSDIIAQVHFPINIKKLGHRIILLDDVQDPGNVGTMIRSALSFGFDQVILSLASADVYNEKVVRSTQGAIFHLSVLRQDLTKIIPLIKEEKILVYATDLKASKGLSTIEKSNKVALVFGNEGNGIHPELLNICDQNIIIEMNQFESLNVAVAAGICMYHFRKLTI
ncbi:MAG: RNA methyltransferase [Erysipelotrichaceae bacterium]